MTVLSKRPSLGRWLLALSAVAITAGCGGSSQNIPTNLASVVGQVLLDDKPLSGCNVSFIPRDQTKGHGGFGITDAEGKFSAVHWSNAKGIEPGTYTVTFSKIAQPDGSPIPEGKNAADVDARETLPPKLTNPNLQHGANVVTVTEAGSELDFKLKSK